MAQPADEFMRAGKLSCLHHTLHRHGRVGKGNILADTSVEEDIVLQDDADLTTQPGRVDMGDVDAIDQHTAALGIETLDQFGDRALAATALAHDPHIRRAGSPCSDRREFSARRGCSETIHSPA